MNIFLCLALVVVSGCGEFKKHIDARTSVTRDPSRYSDLAIVINTFYEEIFSLPGYDSGPHIKAAVAVIDTHPEAQELASEFSSSAGQLQIDLSKELGRDHRRFLANHRDEPIRFMVVCKLLQLSSLTVDSLSQAALIKQATKLLRKTNAKWHTGVWDILSILGWNFEVCKRLYSQNTSCRSEAMLIAEAQYAITVFQGSPEILRMLEDFENALGWLELGIWEAKIRKDPAGQKRFQKLYDALVRVAEAVLQPDTTAKAREETIKSVINASHLTP